MGGLGLGFKVVIPMKLGLGSGWKLCIRVTGTPKVCKITAFMGV